MATKSKYRRVPVEEEKGEKPDNELRVSTRFSPSSYIVNCAKLLLEEKKDLVVLKATGNAIHRCIMVAEVIRRRIKGLYLINKLTNTEITEKYVPIEKGLVDVTIQRTLAVLELVLLKNPTEQDKENPGFQDLLKDSEIEEKNLEEITGTQRRRFNNNYRGGRGGFRGYQNRGGGYRGGGYRGGRGGRDYSRNNSYDSRRGNNSYNNNYRGDRSFSRDYRGDNQNRSFSRNNSYDRYNDRRQDNRKPYYDRNYNNDRKDYRRFNDRSQSKERSTGRPFNNNYNRDNNNKRYDNNRRFDNNRNYNRDNYNKDNYNRDNNRDRSFRGNRGSSQERFRSTDRGDNVKAVYQKPDNRDNREERDNNRGPRRDFRENRDNNNRGNRDFRDNNRGNRGDDFQPRGNRGDDGNSRFNRNNNESSPRGNRNRFEDNKDENRQGGARQYDRGNRDQNFQRRGGPRNN